MTGKIKASFILGILNAERTLKECISSILMQKYPKDKYEIIVVDGGSRDSTIAIVKEFMKNNGNIKLMHNPKKLSEGKGMSKDMGVNAAKGEIVIFLDHDNILLGDRWTSDILAPLENRREIMASQSLLSPMKGDTLFLQYVNSVGVEDPFAIPYSLVSQVALHPKKFKVDREGYYFERLNKDRVLFGGANGCAFRKKVFDIIEGYTRDVDVFAKMAEHKMLVAIPLRARVYHKTSSDLLSFIRKKGLYFYRFINSEYKTKSFKWAKQGKGLSGQLRFFLMVANNILMVQPLLLSINQIIKTGKLFWIIHPFLLFFITLEYGFITLYNFGNFMEYLKK